MKSTLGIIISDSKLTIIGFTMSEAFEYVDSLWSFLRKTYQKLHGVVLL